MRQVGTIGIVGVAAGLAVASACSLKDTADWHDQLEADSPCYRVDLLDGLDETSTAEVQALFACVNHHGHLTSLQPAANALEDPTRTGDPAGIDVARSVNAMTRADVDPFALAGVALDFLQADDRPVDALLDLTLEATYGRRAWRVRHELDLDAPSELERGLLVPLGSVIGPAATALLDDDLRAAAWAGDLLADPETDRWVRTFDSTVRSSDPAVFVPMRDLLPAAGDAVLEARSPGNDVWPGASGDSLRDAVEAYTLGVKQGTPLLEAIAPEAAEILGDPVVQSSLPASLDDLHAAGHLPGVPDEIVVLASTDVQGDPVGWGELSALERLIRLLHDTNRPMRCTVDLGFTDVDVDLGNLAVTMLGIVADQDPDVVQGGAGVLGWVLGWDISESLLYAVADSGSCPALSRQVIDDLGALDRIYEDDAEHTLALFIETLRVLRYAERDRIPAFVDLASELHATGAAQPTAELIRDLGDHPVMQDAVALVPVLVDPASHGVTAGDQRAADLADALDLALWVFERDAGDTGWERMRPLVQAVVSEQGTWQATGNLGVLLADDGSQAARLLDLVEPLIESDPDLVVLDQAGALLADRDIAAPLLRVAETPGFSRALTAAEPLGDDPEVPLAFGARLVVDGTLDDLLRMVDVVLGTLDTLPE